MTININLAVNPMRIAQVVAGGAAVLGGWKVASSIVSNAYRQDLLGDPTRVVEVNDKSVIYQTREPQGRTLSMVMLGAGGVAAAAGGALLAELPAAAKGIATTLRGIGGVGLAALGIGAIGGALATGMNYNGADFQPDR